MWCTVRGLSGAEAKILEIEVGSVRSGGEILQYTILYLLIHCPKTHKC